uniref:Uncharacterized protein n=1 Tax=Sus scrofa TaxID=9823 RepID=A0A4X1VEC0_PIG
AAAPIQPLAWESPYAADWKSKKSFPAFLITKLLSVFSESNQRKNAVFLYLVNIFC